MKIRKYDLLRSDAGIVRVLEMQENCVLIIDYMKRTILIYQDIAALAPAKRGHGKAALIPKLPLGIKQILLYDAQTTSRLRL